jgi:hypothetical protein
VQSLRYALSAEHADVNLLLRYGVHAQKGPPFEAAPPINITACAVAVASGRREIAQHVVKNAAVLEVFDLVQRIDPAQERHLE